ncbi:hypothetical protein PENPOL_c015G00064 [Penicillium polonicum]|uniref:Uncharacterized protein n=1 Tax=Penicillium polonicum TaxID=60169 RepID=A0A1V6NAV0_PENPO|nr:hypothetical protein PENPOL_c015G00064 [Penicillium polonicum]
MDPGKNNILFHTQTLKPILSGYVFKITTDDPKARLLPSMELLQLKWNLSRIAAMQGGGEDEESSKIAMMTPMGILFLFVQVPEHQVGDEAYLAKIHHHSDRLPHHYLYQKSRA